MGAELEIANKACNGDPNSAFAIEYEKQRLAEYQEIAEDSRYGVESANKYIGKNLNEYCEIKLKSINIVLKNSEYK